MISVFVKFLQDMNLNQGCGIDTFLTESCPAVVQALYLLSLKFTLGAYQTEMTCIRKLQTFYFRMFFTDLNTTTMRSFSFKNIYLPRSQAG
jgi:hypothetical protein